MADPDDKLGLLCHEPGACQGGDILASALGQDMTIEDLPYQESSGGNGCPCPDLDRPRVGCCSRDACPVEFPAKDLPAAVMADHHPLDFKMARAESTTEEPTKTVSSSSRARQTSSPDTTHAARSTSYTRTFAAPTTPTSTPTTAPTITTPLDNSTETSPVVPPQKDSLTTTQVIGISVGASVVGLFLLACLIHRILVYVRKRRPGYPHLTDHAPDWQPPVSPVELTEVVAPGTRQCGFGRIPGQATRPSSWEDKGNNEAEAKLRGVAPRRVKSEGPIRLLCASPDSFEHHDDGQVHGHRAPLRVTNGRPTIGPRSVGTDDALANIIHEHQGGQQQTGLSSHASSLRGSNNWATSIQRVPNHGVHPYQGDYTASIDAHSQNYRARPAHSADELRRYTSPYNPAARSDDRLDRFVSHPADEKRPEPHSDGAGRALGSGQYTPRSYEAYMPPDSDSTRRNLQTSGLDGRKAQRKMQELAAEPVGDIRDPRARVTLGDIYVVNPDPAYDESIVSKPAAKNEPQGDAGKAKGGDPAIRESRSVNGDQGSVDKEPVVNIAGDDTDRAFERHIEGQGDNESTKRGTPAQTTSTTSRPQSPVDALRAAKILCTIATPRSVQRLNEHAPQDTTSPTTPTPTDLSLDDAPRLDATGGVPLPDLGSSRPSSISSTAPGSRQSTTETPRRHSGIPSSFTAPTSLASQSQPGGNGLRPEHVPRTLAAPRRRASELHMNIPADNGPRNVSHGRVAQLDRQRHCPDRYTPLSGYDQHDRPSGYGTRYPTYPTTQPRTQHHNTRQAAPYHPTSQHSSTPSHPQTYPHAHHTRVFYPHRAHPPSPMVSPPASATERPRRTAEQLGLGPQPRPAYRTPEGAADLNRGNDIARREAVPGTYQAGSYLRAEGRGYASSGDGGYDGEYSAQYSPAAPLSEYSCHRDEGWRYEQGSTGSAQGSFSSRTWQG